MGLYSAINSTLDPILNPLLGLTPFWAILIISFLISVLITVIYKWLTDQELMKALKQDIKDLQKEMKKFRHKPEKMTEINKKMMQKNTVYMKHSLKPTIFTFLPLILIIGWLNGHYIYDPVSPGESFSVYMVMEDVTIEEAMILLPEGMRLLSSETSDVIRIDKTDNPDNLPFINKQLTSKRSGGFIEEETDIYYAKWDMSANEGLHDIEITVNEQTYIKEITISKKNYGKIIDTIEDGKIKGIFVDRGKLVVLNLFGWKLGWLGAYIIFSLIFSMGLRKILRIH